MLYISLVIVMAKKKRKKAKKRRTRKKPVKRAVKKYKPATIKLGAKPGKRPVKRNNFAIIAALVVIVLAILLIYYGYKTMTGGVAAGVGSSVLSMPPLSTGIVMVIAATALVAVILLAGKKE